MADFPINAVARRAQYVVGSSGQAGPYAYSFPILDDDDIAVYVGSTLKTKTTHYTVTRSLATGTGSITFVGGQEPVENDLVTLISAQALQRTSDYTSGGDLQASSLNDDLDRLTIGQQQISETLDRSIQLPLFTSRDTSSLGNGPLFFPYDATPANQANKVIGYDAAGTSLVTLTPNTGTLISTPGSATDNAVVRFDGTSGTAFQNSPVTIDDAGAVAGVTTLNGTAVSALLDTADIGVTVLAPSGSGASLTGVAKPGAQTVSIPAQACVARTTNGAASATTELATNDVMLAVYDFDAATSEAVQIMIPMPKSWNEGTVTAQFLWTAASSSGDVVWGCRAAALSNDDAIDGSWGTGQTVTDTLTAVNDLCITAATSAITIGGTPAEGDLVVFEFYRDAASGSDTLAADARLISVRLIYTTDAANDA